MLRTAVPSAQVGAIHVHMHTYVTTTSAYFIAATTTLKTAYMPCWNGNTLRINIKW